MPLENTTNSRISLGCVSSCAIAAWGCIIAATVLCDFIKIEGTGSVSGQRESLTRGVWKGQSFVGDSCGSYYGVNQDTRWHTAQAFSVLACVFGFCGICPLLVASGKKLYMSQVMSMSGGCLKAALSSGLVLLLKGSSACDSNLTNLEDRSCTWAVGGNTCIAATVLFAVAGIMMNCSVVGAVAMQQMADEQRGADVEKGAEEPEQANE